MEALNLHNGTCSGLIGMQLCFLTFWESGGKYIPYTFMETDNETQNILTWIFS
jgi:hypothetical protein